MPAKARWQAGGAANGRPSDAPPTAIMRERGHPLRHVFTRAIPTAQCMNCHMHQPNIFLNSYLGYTMWDYESDADLMWPGPENRLPAATPRRQTLSDQRYRPPTRPTSSTAIPKARRRAACGADLDFLRERLRPVNPLARDTQFADYHGHGWNFRAIFKRDREGNLLDADGPIVAPDDPDNFRRDGEGLFVPAGTNPGKTVHMMDIHAEKGLQCADCHFAAGQPRQRLHLWRGRQRDRDRLQGLPRHRPRISNLLTSGPPRRRAATTSR